MNELFGTLSDGTPVHRWTLERVGVRVRVLSYGGIVQSVEVPDRDGNTADVVLGFADLDGYVTHPEPYLVAAERLGVDPAACVAIEDSAPGTASAVVTLWSLPRRAPRWS